MNGDFLVLLTVTSSNNKDSKAWGRAVVRQVRGDDEDITRLARLMSGEHKACVTISVVKGTMHVVGCDDQPNGGLTPEPTTNS